MNKSTLPVVCDRCRTAKLDRQIPFGDRKIIVRMCECRAARLTTKYVNTKFGGK
jgi:hypothetical protein